MSKAVEIDIYTEVVKTLVYRLKDDFKLQERYKDYANVVKYRKRLRKLLEVPYPNELNHDLRIKLNESEVEQSKFRDEMYKTMKLRVLDMISNDVTWALIQKYDEDEFY